MAASAGASFCGSLDSQNCAEQATDKPAESKAPVSSRGRPVAGGPVRSPFFSGDLLHDLDLEVAVGNDLLEAGVPLLELPQPLEVRGLQRAEARAPGIDGCVAR